MDIFFANLSLQNGENMTNIQYSTEFDHLIKTTYGEDSDIYRALLSGDDIGEYLEADQDKAHQICYEQYLVECYIQSL